ncbi:hypothetical protein SSS_09654 [Sarcoptes scabiei]|nr:hypothetical protein SSS_09654 [Sarcoptes scabiei]
MSYNSSRWLRLPEGYVRTGKDGTGRCVPLGKCKHCPHHERRAFCRGHCQPTCKNPHPKCSLKCRRGCRCRLGYVRSRPGGPCIKRNTLQKTSSLEIISYHFRTNSIRVEYKTL